VHAWWSADGAHTHLVLSVRNSGGSTVASVLDGKWEGPALVLADATDCTAAFRDGAIRPDRSTANDGTEPDYDAACRADHRRAAVGFPLVMTEADMSALPPEIDTSRPHSARIYDYYLGGKNHFAADREVAEKSLASVPSGRIGAREQRGFLGRAVRYLTGEAGIRQFLDIGTGLPTADNVHEVAQETAPSTRVVYVDNDPLVLAHARALLTSSDEGRTAYIHADLRSPGEILSSPVVRDVLDFSQPVALMLVGILHFLEDKDEPEQIIDTLLGALPPGSYLTASHLNPEHDPVGVAAGVRAYQAGGVAVQARDSSEFAALAFRGLELIPPGVVSVSEWRPDSPEPRPTLAEVSCYGAVGRKP
jgi:S-adenosyl methyltransferase